MGGVAVDVEGGESAAGNAGTGGAGGNGTALSRRTGALGRRTGQVLRSTISRLGGWVRTAPLTVSLMVAVVTVHVLGSGLWGRLPHRPGSIWGFQAGDLVDGRWWSIATAVLLSANTGTMLLALAVLAGLLGLAEATIGTRRAAAFFIATQLTGVLLFAAVVWLGGIAGIDWPPGYAQASLLGPFAASAGTLMAASQAISLLWRRRVRVLTFAGIAMLNVYVGHAQHLLILLSCVAGLLLGTWLVKAVGVGVVGRSTSREVRTNLALVVAVFAIGPVVAAAVHGAEGPLAVLRMWITSQEFTAQQWNHGCQTAAGPCSLLPHNAGLLDSGAHLLAMVPMVLLLVCAAGLRRGSRLALWVAVYLHVVIGLVSAFHFQVFAGLGLPLHRGHRTLSISESVWELLPVVLAPLLIAGFLVAFRRHFPVDPDPAQRRRALVALPLLLAACVALYSVAWFAEGNEHGPLGIGGLLGGIPRLVLPYPFSASYVRAVYPQGLYSTLLFSFGGAVMWLLGAAGMLALFASRHLRHVPDDAATARELVRRGGDSLSWMTLWDNNQYWFNAAGTAGVAYQVHNGVAVTVGGPIGEPADAAAAMEGFLAHCTDESLTPCFYSVAEDRAAPLRALGFRSMEVAQETLLDVRDMDFKGKDWQNVRTALNKAGKLGITARWLTWNELSPGQRTQLNEISEDWVSGQALPELGFTLGGLEELKDAAVQLCLAIDGDGRIHAVTSWLPVFDHGVVVGWTLDFMRRNAGAFNGVMEYLIAQAVRHFAETVDWISLSGSPLATGPAVQDGGPGSTDGGATPGSLDRVLALVSRTLEPVYGFASLATFKQRFKPRHRPLFLMYQDPLALPAIGRAVAQAYLPTMSVRSLPKLLRKAG